MTVATIRFELDHGAIGAFLNSAAVTAVLEARGRAMAAAANGMAAGHHRVSSAEPFTTDTVHNASRVVVFVRTNSADGARLEARDRILSKAVNA
jgi:hypothetical protein